MNSIHQNPGLGTPGNLLDCKKAGLAHYSPLLAQTNKKN